VRLRLVGVGGEAVELPLVRTFGEVGWGEPLAYWGSNGYLEVAVNSGSAARQLDITDDAVLTLVRI
jgi:S-adenosylmethionine hydrolase